METLKNRGCDALIHRCKELMHGRTLQGTSMALIADVTNQAKVRKRTRYDYHGLD